MQVIGKLRADERVDGEGALIVGIQWPQQDIGTEITRERPTAVTCGLFTDSAIQRRVVLLVLKPLG